MARRLPADLDAERALLGAMLLSPQVCMTMIDEEDIQPGEFFSPTNQMIYAAMGELWRAGSPIDPVTVNSHNREIELPTLMELMGATPSVSAAGRYSSVVREMAMRRRLVALGSMVAEDAMAGSLTAAEIQSRAEAGVAEVGSAVEGLTGELSGFYESPSSMFPEGYDINDSNPWVVDRLLRAEEALIIVGQGGAGKSTFLRQLGYTARNGLDWVTGFKLPNRTPKKVLVVECEAKKHNVAHSASMLRIGVARHLGIPASEVLEPAVLMAPGKFDVRDPRTRARLVAAIRLVQPDLVCIGPLKNLQTMRPGEPYEVTAVETQAVFDALKAKYGFALAMEAHSNRSDPLSVAGSARWADWPDIGFALNTADGDAESGSEITFDVIRFRLDRNHEVLLPGTLIRAQKGKYLPFSCDFETERRIMDKIRGGSGAPLPKAHMV